MPTDKELDEIVEKEERLVEKANIYPNIHEAPSTKCSRCSQENSFTSGSYLTSQYGGLTWQYICKSCGYHLDTGEFFD